MLQLGAHISAAGGAHKIFARGQKIGCECLQLFTRPPSRWRATPLDPDQVKLFRAERERQQNPSVIAHDIYLNNLAAENDEVRERSIATMIEELERCHQLGIDGLVCHIGSHKAGPEVGIPRYAEAVQKILTATRDTPTPILLETCAGQGTCLGHQLEHLGQIIDLNKGHERLGVCVDTCHIFVAGYNLGSEALYHEFWSHFDRVIGLDRLKALHLNDSKKPLGSRVDRHDHIGEGEIGPGVFECLLKDPRMKGLPAVIETPESETMAKTNLDRLKSMRGKTATIH